MREERELDLVPAMHLCAGDRHLRAGWVLAIGVVVAADQAGRAQQREGHLGAAIDQLVLHDVIQQHAEAARLDPAMGRKGGQGLLAISTLAGKPALDHGELALRVRPIRPPRQGNVEPDAMVVRVVDE